MSLQRTRNDLPEASREKTVATLEVLLASAIDLTLQTKQAHWNVKGPGFRELHLLFDEVYQVGSEWQDSIAERIAQLGGTAQGNLATVVKATRLAPFAPARSDGPAYVDGIARALVAFTSEARPAIDRVTADGDTVTADVLTEIVRGADMKLWMVEAHLQADR